MAGSHREERTPHWILHAFLAARASHQSASVARVTRFWMVP